MRGGGESRSPKYLVPIEPDQTARRQFSFSRLSGAMREFSDQGPKIAEADDYAEPSRDPRGLGTLIHAALAEVDFAKPGDVMAIIQRHSAQHFLQPGDEFNDAVDMLGRFLGSPRAAQIASGKEVYRELEFMLAWPPGSRDQNGPYLQGFIDCLYQDAAGAWHIIDYKTNRVTADSLKKTAANYEMQMLVYALAAETILKQPPTELTLCFLRPGLEFQFSWNEKNKRRLVDLVSQAMKVPG